MWCSRCHEYSRSRAFLKSVRSGLRGGALMLLRSINHVTEKEGEGKRLPSHQVRLADDSQERE
jgi:hypothetical protein